MKSSNLLLLGILAATATIISGCEFKGSSDRLQQDAQEKILMDINAQTGMPAIKNSREKKLLKDILEKRDQDGFTTTTYLVNLDGNLVFLL